MLASARFELRRLTDAEWLILDHRYEATDARHTVACVCPIAEDQVEVVWLRSVSTDSRYATAADVLEAVQRAHAQNEAS